MIRKAEMNRLRAQNAALFNALRAANIENEELTKKLESLTVENCMLENENKRLLDHVDLLRGVPVV